MPPILEFLIVVLALLALAYAAMRGVVWFLERGTRRRD
jgi:hypothetical protein